MLPKDFYEKIEVPGSLKNILYSDTDSIYITIPTKEKVTTISLEDRWLLVLEAAQKINETIIKYLNEYYLPKSNISPEFNKTFFKSELMAESMMFLDVKKSYGYKILSKEGVMFPEGKIKYTGIQIVKSDAAKMTQNILKKMIEDVILNTNIKNKDKEKELINIVSYFENDFRNKAKNFEFDEISFPSKFGKKIQIINAMKLYNFTINEQIFGTASSGKFIYCNFKNLNLFKNSGLDMEKTNGICIPYKYNKEKIIDMFNKFQIEIDLKTQWERIFSTSCGRVIEISKLI